MPTKKEIRTSVRKSIMALTADQRLAASNELLNRLAVHERFLSAKVVMLFHSLPDEINTHQFIDDWASKKIILLPVVQGDDLELRQYIKGEQMCETDFHIEAPQGNIFTNLSAIDLVVVPGVAFDKSGNRMGRGRGYYDRFLSQQSVSKAYKLGICFAQQMIDNIPTEAHDIRMDEVIHSLF